MLKKVLLISFLVFISTKPGLFDPMGEQGEISDEERRESELKTRQAIRAYNAILTRERLKVRKGQPLPPGQSFKTVVKNCFQKEYPDLYEYHPNTCAIL